MQIKRHPHVSSNLLYWKTVEMTILIKCQLKNLKKKSVIHVNLLLSFPGVYRIALSRQQITLICKRCTVRHLTEHCFHTADMQIEEIYLEKVLKKIIPRNAVVLAASMWTLCAKIIYLVCVDEMQCNKWV